MDIFGSLIERPMIKQEFEQNYPKVVELMDDDLIAVKIIYDDHMQVNIHFYFKKKLSNYKK